MSLPTLLQAVLFASQHMRKQGHILAQIFSLFACKDQIFITTCAKTVPVLQGL